MLFDPEFEEVVNMSSTELPTKGGNVIDFKTLQVRPRCHSDYWSYELNSEYIPIPSSAATTDIDKEKVEERRFVIEMLTTFCNDDIEMFELSSTSGWRDVHSRGSNYEKNLHFCRENGYG